MQKQLSKSRCGDAAGSQQSLPEVVPMTVPAATGTNLSAPRPITILSLIKRQKIRLKI